MIRWNKWRSEYSTHSWRYPRIRESWIILFSHHLSSESHSLYFFIFFDLLLEFDIFLHLKREWWLQNDAPSPSCIGSVYDQAREYDESNNTNTHVLIVAEYLIIAKNVVIMKNLSIWDTCYDVELIRASSWVFLWRSSDSPVTSMPSYIARRRIQKGSLFHSDTLLLVLMIHWEPHRQ